MVGAHNVTSCYLSASAGSGKTYALSMRFCRLLVAGVPPEAVCALTFTRAATREIFSAVVKRLLEKPAELSGGMLSPEVALERLLNALPRLQISTIDAFSAKIARLFAYELGLGPDFSLYESETSVEARELIREMVRCALQATTPHAAEALLRQFSLTYEGVGNNQSLTEQLSEFFHLYGDLAERVPVGWGDLDRITEPLPGESQERIPARSHDRFSDYEALCAVLTDSEFALMTDEGQASLRNILGTYDPAIESVREASARGLDSKWREKFFKLQAEGGFQYRSKKNRVDFNAREMRALNSLCSDLLARDLEQTAHHTQMLYTAILALNRAAETQRRELGRFSLAYLVKLLSKTVGSKLSFLDPALCYVTFRLDSAIRHLMVDEFQDTSTDQWAILNNLAQELTDDSESTFFYVGDVKQSIYGWRGGDSTLFGDPARVPDIPQGAPLINSYRSRPAVIELVNRLMNFDAYIKPERVNPWQVGPLETWKDLWVDHVAQNDEPAYAAVLTVKGKKEIYRATIADYIASRWRDLSGREFVEKNGKRRNLTVAVLANQTDTFTGGDTGVGLLAQLRLRGVDCAIDGKRDIADLPIGRLVLALLRWMADPRDTFRGEMAYRLGICDANASRVVNGWIRRVHEAGFVSWITDVLGPASAIYPALTDADHEILAAVIHVLDGIDAQNSTDPIFAAKAIQAHQIACAADPNILSLMTVHHSKGLTYDVVFTIADGQMDNPQAVMYEATESWVLEKPVCTELYGACPRLTEAASARREARFKDTLCMLYVSITRAQYEQIVILPESKRKDYSARAAFFADCVEGEKPEETEFEGLNYALQLGDKDWWRRTEKRVSSVITEPDSDWLCVRTHQLPEVELPSARAQTTTVANFFAEGADDARTYGISVHDELAAVAWTDSPPYGLFPEVFKKPDEPCELWRERAFSVKLKDDSDALHYLAGQFDRVHLFPESRRAVIYDFKTSAVPIATPEYCRQLRDYSRAVTALTGYPPESIQRILLFTRCGKAVEVPDA